MHRVGAGLGKGTRKDHRAQKEGSGRFHGKGQGLPNPESPIAQCPVPRVGSALPTQPHTGAAGVKRMWDAHWLVCILQPSVLLPHPLGPHRSGGHILAHAVALVRTA